MWFRAVSQVRANTARLTWHCRARNEGVASLTIYHFWMICRLLSQQNKYGYAAPHCLCEASISCSRISSSLIKDSVCTVFDKYKHFFILCVCIWIHYLNYAALAFHPENQFVDIHDIAYWDFYQDCFESVDQGGKKCYLNNTDSSKTWTWNTSPFI